MLAEVNKKNWTQQHPELLCCRPKGHFESKIKLSLDRESKHALLYLYLPDYIASQQFKFSDTGMRIFVQFLKFYLVLIEHAFSVHFENEKFDKNNYSKIVDKQSY